MENFPKPTKLTTLETFSLVVSLFDVCNDSKFLHEISNYVSTQDGREVLGLCLTLKAFNSVLKPNVIFKAWKNHNNRNEPFRIDMFTRKKTTQHLYKDLREYSLELALMYPDDYIKYRSLVAKCLKIDENNYKNERMIADAFDRPNEEAILLGFIDPEQDHTIDLCVEFEEGDTIYTISAYSLFRKYGYNFGEEDV